MTNKSADSNPAYVRVGDQTDAVNGNVRIRPGDKVLYKSRWCRVVEVYPKEDDLDRVLLYRQAAMHSGTEKVTLEAIKGYRGRDDQPDE